MAGNTHPEIPVDPQLLPRGKAIYFPPLRRLWRLVHQVWIRFFGQARSRQLTLENAGGYPMLVLPQVFNPALLRTGDFLARCLESQEIREETTVLDMGTGSGIGSVAAARWSKRVTAADINPEAVRCAGINVRLNRLEDRVEIVESDLFTNLGDRRFDRVLFNPPFFLGRPADLLDHAWRSQDVIPRFAAQLGEHLTPKGQGLIVFSSHGDCAGLIRAFQANGFQVEKLRELDLIDEILLLYRVQPTAGSGS